MALSFAKIEACWNMIKFRQGSMIYNCFLQSVGQSLKDFVHLEMLTIHFEDNLYTCYCILVWRPSNINLGRLATNCNVEICCPTCALRRCDDTNQCSGDLLWEFYTNDVRQLHFQVLFFRYRPKEKIMTKMSTWLKFNPKFGIRIFFQLPTSIIFQGQTSC